MYTHSPTAGIGVDFRPLAFPPSVDDPAAADFIEMVRVRNEVYLEINRHDDESIAADELLAIYQPDEYRVRYSWMILVDGEAVGRCGVDIPLEEGSQVAFWIVELLRRVWDRGIGSAAYDLIERTAREHGRTVLQSWASHPDAPGERIDSPTGFGSIPDDHAARFYRKRGYTLEQVERNSALDLHTSRARIEGLLAEARESSTDYEVVHWFVPTPAEFVEGYAWMKSRMITDAPAAALEFDEEVWDAARLAHHEEPYLETGRSMQVTAARHVATGELCAFNELEIGKDLGEATHQGDTLVLKEHRGHRLGMLVKCAGLLSWMDYAPKSQRVLTYNAEENRPMLDINEAIGFAPIAYGGGWKKVLDA